ncbi:hypothetical protein BG003_000653 [Podila horticola]|nr:hypothetical protein BG003_000653 [Podila horticola]
MVLRIWEVEMQRDPEWHEPCKLETYWTPPAHLTGVERQRHEIWMDNTARATATTLCNKYATNSDTLQHQYGNTDVNAALFLRDMVIYKELSAAIKMGDVGRIEKVLRVITIMFQAGGTRNYANQLLHVAYGIRRGWGSQFKKAIVRSWLINPKGVEDGWIPADLYQEHNNLLTKTVHFAKGSNMSWSTLSKSISTNIRLFSDIASKIEGEFNISHNSKYHTTVSAYGKVPDI